MVKSYLWVTRENISKATVNKNNDGGDGGSDAKF